MRLYLVNITEFDPINSFHLHGNFFNYYDTGTSLEPTVFTDNIMQIQAQRGILEFHFRDFEPGCTCSTPISRSSWSSAGWGSSMSWRAAVSVSEKKPENRATSRVVVLGLLPLIALGIVVFAFVRTDPLEGVRERFRPLRS